MNNLDQILAAVPRSPLLPSDSVAPSPELERVRALPRRPLAGEDLIDLMSEWLRLRPVNDAGEPNRLRPAQAEALRELYDVRGLVAPMRVGSGKTLVTLLAATVLAAERPVLVIPASLKAKTRREFVEYRKDWAVRLPKLISYQALGHRDHERDLDELRPDLLILDEAQAVRSPDPAVSRRVGRYIRQHHPVVITLSGTLITDALLDYWQLTAWCLGQHAPVPLVHAEAERWAQAVDRDVGTIRRVQAGELASLPGGFHEWYRGSRGIVCTPGQDCDAAIEISMWRPTLPAPLKQTIETVAASSLRPDGELLDEWELPDCLCQLALGFYYVWDPMPPSWWLNPRRGWRAYVRAVLDEHADGFDSESPIVSALDRQTGPQPPAAAEGRALLAAWRAVRDSFVPNPVPVWLSPDVIHQAVQCEPGTLIWSRYRAAGQALEACGVPWYPGQTHPEAAAPGTTIALSISAHSTGRNLQAWSRSRVLTPMASSEPWEQLIGRTHRQGQRADTVSVEIINAIPYHDAVIRRVLTESRRVSRASGFSQKLTDATWI